MSEDLRKNLMELILSAVALANSVQQDIADERIITYDTVLALNDFQTKHDELDTILDIVNGIN